MSRNAAPSEMIEINYPMSFVNYDPATIHSTEPSS